VDVGCGVGSFARAMAHHAEASTPGDTSAPNAWWMWPWHSLSWRAIPLSLSLRGMGPCPGLQENGRSICNAARVLWQPCSAEMDWNVLGLDVNPVAVRRCQAMAARDNLVHRCDQPLCKMGSQWIGSTCFSLLRLLLAPRIMLPG